MKKYYLDSLTGIKNEEYLKQNYTLFISTYGYNNVNFVMIDIQNFKNINDSLGHNTGDIYIKTLATIFDKNFEDSIVVRLHGDEFAILTNYDENEIERKFVICKQEIHLAVKTEEIPIYFNFNAGSVKAEYNLDTTKEKADFLMYYAKRHNKMYQKSSESLLNRKIYQEKYLKKLDNLSKKNNFSYKIRELFNKDLVGQNIFKVYTKGLNGQSIFGDDNYKILKYSSNLVDFDFSNIQRILERADFENKKMFLSIDYKTLILSYDLFDYLTVMAEKLNLQLSNLILSVDLSAIETNNYKILIDKINELKKLNVGVRLDKFDNNIGDIIWEQPLVDYIRIGNDYWKSSINNVRKKSSLKAKLSAFEECQIIPVFECVENKKEHEYLKSISPTNTLFSGNYYSEEKTLTLK